MATYSEKFICSICGKIFSKISYHNKHVKNVHKIDSKGEKLPDDRYTCVSCVKQFHSKASLQRHMNAIHVDDNSVSSGFVCEQCGYKTTEKSNLKRHTLKKHDVTKDEGKRPLKCSQCPSRFTYLRHLKYHERRSHRVGSVKKRSFMRKCPICSFVSTKKTRIEIRSHFEDVHNVPMRWETYTFDNLQLFHDWKNHLEKTTTTSYVERVKSKQYICHRSGSFKTHGKNIRHPRLVGSCKINGFCPSEIKLNVQENGRVEAKYLPCHVGHKNQSEYIRLSSQEKGLLNMTPHDYTLSQIRTSLSNQDLRRIHIEKKRDIMNMEKSFNLNNEEMKHSISIEDFAEVLKNDENTSVLHYKPQGVVIENQPHLKEDDFLLIHMSKAQQTLVEKYGRGVICLDNTHGLKRYSLQLYTLLIMDESREGFPVAFLFTSKNNKYVLSTFFKKIKEQCGQITPSAFMSDMDETLYSAWSDVMGPAKLRVYCSWHVLTAWRKNLSQIKNKDIREEVYNILKSLLYELDEQVFHNLLHDAMETLKNDDLTEDYYNYFEDQFVKDRRYEQWAFCYRINSGINTNMTLENYNRVLKYSYLKGRKIIRLDKTLLNLIRDQLFDWLIQLKENKLISSLRSLRRQHKESFLIPESNITSKDDHTWQVDCSIGQELYTVKRIQECSKCQLQCIHCESCFHEYICSCMDNALKNTMCKHIHLVARVDGGKPKPKTDVLEEQECKVEIDNSCVENTEIVEEVIIYEVCMEDMIDNEEIQKQRLTEKLELFSDYVNKNVNTKDQMEYVENSVSQILSTLHTMAPSSQ